MMPGVTMFRPSASYGSRGGADAGQADYYRKLQERGVTLSPERAAAAGGEAGGGGFASEVGQMHEQRLAELMGRIPSQQLTQLAEPMLRGELEAGAWEGPTPEQRAYEEYAPRIEAQAVQGLTRRGIQSGAAAGATVTRRLGEFAAPLAIEEARGTERRRSEHVNRLMQALGMGIEGARTSAAAPWPDWMRAAEIEGRGAGGTTHIGAGGSFGGDRQSPFGALSLLRAAGNEPRTSYPRQTYPTYSPGTGSLPKSYDTGGGSYYSPAETEYRPPTYA